MSGNRIATLLLALAAPAGVALADGITFEEIPPANANCCFLSDEYLHMGVEFVTTDDGSVWDGLANGDPGYWRLNGSNGPSFLGFNGRSYKASVLFDAPVRDFSMDVARGHGSSGTVKIKVTGYLAGEFVDMGVVFLMGTNQWIPVLLEGDIDEVGVRTAGNTSFRPYGVDNLQWVQAGPQWLPIEIDVKPESDDDRINPRSRGVVPVLVLGSEALGVDQIHADSLACGPAGASRAHRSGPHYTDANGDGLLDLIAHFRVQELGLEPGDEQLCLTGETSDGIPLEGCDAVSPIGGGDTPEVQGDGHGHRRGNPHRGRAGSRS